MLFICYISYIITNRGPDRNRLVHNGVQFFKQFFKHYSFHCVLTDIDTEIMQSLILKLFASIRFQWVNQEYIIVS